MVMLIIWKIIYLILIISLLITLWFTLFTRLSLLILSLSTSIRKYVKAKSSLIYLQLMPITLISKLWLTKLIPFILKFLYYVPVYLYTLKKYNQKAYNKYYDPTVVLFLPLYLFLPYRYRVILKYTPVILPKDVDMLFIRTPALKFVFLLKREYIKRYVLI